MEVNYADEVKEHIAIGWTIIHRVEDVRWKNTLPDVIFTPEHFSIFNPGDPGVEFSFNFLTKGTTFFSDYKYYIRLAKQILEKLHPDFSNNATNYVSSKLYRQLMREGSQHWSTKLQIVSAVGGHVFFRE